MSEAASRVGVQPWQIRFKATRTTLVEALAVLEMIRDPADLCRVVFACCQQHRVGDGADAPSRTISCRSPDATTNPEKPETYDGLSAFHA